MPFLGESGDSGKYAVKGWQVSMLYSDSKNQKPLFSLLILGRMKQKHMFNF